MMSFLFDVVAYRYLLELGMLVFLTELVLLGLRGKWYSLNFWFQWFVIFFFLN